MPVNLTMEKIPTTVQTNQATSTHQTFNTNITSGNILIVYYSDVSAISGVSIADTLASTWTQRSTLTASGTTIFAWTATAPSSGSDTVTITVTGSTNPVLTIIECTNVTELVDSAVSLSSSVSGSHTITMPNVTTTHYRDLVLDFIAVGGNVGAIHDAAYVSTFIAEDSTIGNATHHIESRLTGNPGTITGNTYSTTASVNAGVLSIVLALQATSTLKVSTQAIPDAVVGQSYSFQMQATGGAGTNVWTITSGLLPNGLSLSSAGVISGTPTASNGNTIRFTVTDSASASNFADLTLHVGAAANTITRVQGGGGNSLTGITAGNIILVGIVNTVAFASLYAETPVVTDGFGTVYKPIPGISTNYGFLFWGIAGASGNLVVNLSPAQSSGFTWVSEWTNIQPIFDTGVVSNYLSTTGASPVSSAPITIPVTEMLYAFASPGTSGATVTASSPFVRDVNASGGTVPVQLEADYALNQAAGSQSATWTTSGNTSNNFTMTLLGFRPTVFATATAASMTGRATVTANLTSPPVSLQANIVGRAFIHAVMVGLTACLPVQIINGSFQDSEGNPLSNGFLLFRLNQDEKISCSGQLTSEIVVQVNLDVNGNVLGTQYMWPNDLLLPSNSYYLVRAYTSRGQLAWGPVPHFVVTPTPFDLNTWT